MKSLPLLAAALFARISLADRDLIFPVVHMGDAGADDDEYADFHAQVMHVDGDVTTYSVGCATDPCAGWGNLPDFTYTMAIGPSTIDFVYTDGPQYSTHSACTFTGSPTPTAASCSMTNADTIRTHTMGYEHSYTIPGGTGVWQFWNIQMATLKVLDGTVAASTTTGTGARSTSESESANESESESGTKSGSGSSMVTPTPTVTGTETSAGASGVSSAGQASESAPLSSGVAGTVGTGAWKVGLGMAVLGMGAGL